MPRDRNAALAAWAKRGRGKGDGNTVEAADIIAPGAGTGTRRGMVEGFRAMRNMKDAIASADAKRVTPMSARTAGRAAKAAAEAAAKQARAPKGGPMAGLGTTHRKAIGQKAAEKRRANRLKAEPEAKATPPQAAAKSELELFGRSVHDKPGSAAFNDAFS